MVKKSDVIKSKKVRWLSCIDLFFIAKMCFAKYMTVLYTVYRRDEYYSKHLEIFPAITIKIS